MKESREDNPLDTWHVVARVSEDIRQILKNNNNRLFIEVSSHCIVDKLWLVLAKTTTNQAVNDHHCHKQLVYAGTEYDRELGCSIIVVVVVGGIKFVVAVVVVRGVGCGCDG